LRAVCHHHLGPELADAARVQVRVAVQVGARVEGADPIRHLGRKALESLDHRLGQRQ
jgi:hypothetical protein